MPSGFWYTILTSNVSINSGLVLTEVFFFGDNVTVPALAFVWAYQRKRLKNVRIAGGGRKNLLCQENPSAGCANILYSIIEFR